MKKIRARIKAKGKEAALRVTRDRKPSIEEQLINIYLYAGENQFEEAESVGAEADS